MTIPEWVADTGPWIGLLGGLVGLFGGGLSIYYGSTANRVLLKRFAREEDEHAVAARRDHLLRMATEYVQNSTSPVTQQVIRVKLGGELDRRAAWALVKDDVPSIAGNECLIPRSKLPRGFIPHRGEPKGSHE